MIVLQEDKVQSVIETLIRTRTPLRINVPERMPVTFTAASINSGSKTIQMSWQDVSGRPKPIVDSRASIRFRLASIPFQFDSILRGWSDETTTTWDLPQDIIAQSGREQLRVVVPDALLIKIQLAFAGGNVTGHCIDISHAGAQCTIEEDEKHVLASGLPGVAFISSPFGTCHLDCIVMWKTQTAFGVLLPQLRSVLPREINHPWVRILTETVMNSIAFVDRNIHRPLQGI